MLPVRAGTTAFKFGPHSTARAARTGAAARRREPGGSRRRRGPAAPRAGGRRSRARGGVWGRTWNRGRRFKLRSKSESTRRSKPKADRRLRPNRRSGIEPTQGRTGVRFRTGAHPPPRIESRSRPSRSVRVDPERRGGRCASAHDAPEAAAGDDRDPRRRRRRSRPPSGPPAVPAQRVWVRRRRGAA